MAMRLGLLGKKIGMTQVFADDGERVPVTVIQTGPCVVVGKRTVDKDGYSALVLGFDEKPLRLANKAELGLAKAANTKAIQHAAACKPNSQCLRRPWWSTKGAHKNLIAQGRAKNCRKPICVNDQPASRNSTGKARVKKPKGRP